MKRVRNTLGPLVCYHGCERATAEKILGGRSILKPSENDYDWLGPGIYFWVDSVERGLEWGKNQVRRKGSKIKDPYVIGAFVHPGLCLNLTDYGVMDELLNAHGYLARSLKQAQTPLPKNQLQTSGIYLKRNLDCAVIRTVHSLRKEAKAPLYDSVYGVFEEGRPLYPGAGFKAKTHVQLAVLNTDCIIGYFRVAGL